MAISPSYVRHKIALSIALVVGIVGMALAWSFSPLHEVLDVARAVESLQSIAHGFGPGAAVLLFATALTVAVPLTFLTLVFIVAYGPVDGFFYVMLGAQIGALCSFGLGAVLGRDVLRVWGGARVRQLSEKLGARGMLAVIAVRLVPVAPFAVVNMVAGATHIRLRDLLLGTLFGMAPGTLAIALFIEKILATLQHPGKGSYLALLALLAAIGLVLVGIRIWLRHTTDFPRSAE